VPTVLKSGSYNLLELSEPVLGLLYFDLGIEMNKGQVFKFYSRRVASRREITKYLMHCAWSTS
jgi:hypothetical protein